MFVVCLAARLSCFSLFEYLSQRRCNTMSHAAAMFATSTFWFQQQVNDFCAVLSNRSQQLRMHAQAQHERDVIVDGIFVGHCIVLIETTGCYQCHTMSVRRGEAVWCGGCFYSHM